MRKDLLIINLFGQEKIDSSVILSYYSHVHVSEKETFQRVLIDLILQAKCTNDDVVAAISESGVKETATSVVILKKGIQYQNLIRLFQLREDHNSLLLLVNLFRIGYKRRRDEDVSAHKWWNKDLSAELL